MNSLCQLAADWRGDCPPAGILAEEKIDGWRALYLRDHTGTARLYTRNGHRIEGTGHILHQLAEMERAAGELMVFDGEFQIDGALSATKKWCESGWKAGGEAGQFFGFDCLTLSEWRSGGTDRSAIDRKAILKDLAETAQSDAWEWRPGSRGRDDLLPPVVILPDLWCFDAGDVLTEARRVWAQGGEGLMLKDAEAGYQRARVKAWQKVKQGGPWSR
ncbi:hypothetical protein GRI39_01880 [Altererythrobacter indicus]|uniref:ATP-dependent DNA ligase family profile domain-containing protein n=1 Tax=Altericroceibacterium indicum TaxID=374177 RepID=A0A845A7K3_9SPHN|nr:hypothetical protein [Altericroceibacterium indicum]MXP24795.1 hypothetical protein [Altericroceibacterium indicum]